MGRTPPTPAFSSTFSHHPATSSLRTCKPPFSSEDDPASLHSPPSPLSLIGSALAVGPGGLHLHPRLQLQDAIQRRVEDNLQPILQQPDPRPASGCSST